MNRKSILNEIEQLKRRLNQLEEKLNSIDEMNHLSNKIHPSAMLSNYETHRYGRQIILKDFGPQSQQKLKKSSVCIVGCGGLGTSAASILAGAGIGTIGVFDYDIVELSNLHRQIFHSEVNIGELKTDSLCSNLERLNSSINIIKHNMKLTHCDAESINIFKNYDVIIDATDNLIARYVLNDICVSLAKPIVSGAALSLYGQLTVYNYQNSPCFRCIHPVRKIDRNETCASAGVLGVVPCIIGMLQALEVIKMCTGMGEVLHEQMLLFDSMLMSFRKINLRKRSNLCNSCSSPEPLKIDYTSLCQCEPIPTIDDDFNISVQQYIKNNNDDIIIDVRPPNEYLICRIEKSKNIFLGDLLKMKQEKIEQIKDKDKMYIICRRGNASRIATRFLNSLNLSFKAINIVGGLESWSKFGDKMFPLY